MRLLELFEDFTSPHSIIKNQVNDGTERYWIDTNTKNIYTVNEDYHWYFVVAHPELFGIDGNDPNNGIFEDFDGNSCTVEKYIDEYKSHHRSIPDYPWHQMEMVEYKGYVRAYITSYRVTLEAYSLKFIHKASKILLDYGAFDRDENVQLYMDTKDGNNNGLVLSGERLQLFLKNGTIPMRENVSAEVEKKWIIRGKYPDGKKLQFSVLAFDFFEAERKAEAQIKKSKLNPIITDIVHQDSSFSKRERT